MNVEEVTTLLGNYSISQVAVVCGAFFCITLFLKLSKKVIGTAAIIAIAIVALKGFGVL